MSTTTSYSTDETHSICSLCYLKEGPCGGVPSASPITKLTGGQEFSIAFQQNLNHFYIENPGRLVADFAEKADPAEEDFTALGLPVADYNAVSVCFCAGDVKEPAR